MKFHIFSNWFRKCYFDMSRYHVPRSWFKPSGNTLVILEEKGGNPTKVRFSRRKQTGVCALVGEDYPSHEIGKARSSAANLNLQCPNRTRISSVKFASFGTPRGTCGSYSKGECHDPNSISIVEKVSSDTCLSGCEIFV